jgi:prepilin-type N-terminal cleavage/methylation domain-containing protein
MKDLLQRARTDEGFTLIELMIVIVILGVLAGIVVFAVGGITDRGTSAACKTDVSTITTAVEAFYAKNNSYPLHIVPDLTNPATGNQFLKWDASFTGSADATGPASDEKTGNGYTIAYQPGSGDVWVAPGNSSTPTASSTCPA